MIKSLTRIGGKVARTVAKHSPEILLGIGLTAGAGAIVTAVRSSLKVGESVDTLEEKMEEVKILKADDGVDKKDIKKATFNAYKDFSIDMIKLYWPTVVLSLGSCACILGSYGILKKRNAALLAAYADISAAFASYREKVKEKYGEDVDRELIFADAVNANAVTNEKGKVVSSIPEKELICSPYARFFDSSCPNYEKSAEYNIAFLTTVQNNMNDKLRINGCVFLNEVYDALGFERTSAGAVVGWLYKGDGDGYIDFGIFDPKDDTKRRFVNNLEPVILLDFNVDGVIYDKI